MTIRIEFPADRLAIAAILGRALIELADGAAALPLVTTEETPIADTPSAPAVSAQPAAPEAPTEATLVRRDPKGVAYDPEYCGSAKDPFYGSGTRAGQWKKRRGLDDSTYDAWYAERLATLGPSEEQPGSVDTSAAFSEAPPPAAETWQPQNVGEFMGWVSEQQAAGNLGQETINAAWMEAGIGIADLYGQSEEAIQTNVARIYAVLNSKVPA
jgi:hypothetical protein